MKEKIYMIFFVCKNGKCKNYILQDLLKLYTDMYPSKELFNKVYFK